MFKSESTKYYYIEDVNPMGSFRLKIISVNKIKRKTDMIWHYSVFDPYKDILYHLYKSIIVNRKNAILNLRHKDNDVRQLCELILRLNRNINRGNKKWKRFQQVQQN